MRKNSSGVLQGAGEDRVVCGRLLESSSGDVSFADWPVQVLVSSNGDIVVHVNDLGFALIGILGVDMEDSNNFHRAMALAKRDRNGCEFCPT